MADYKVISADSHIVEAPDLWEKWIDPRFRDRAPRVIKKKGFGTSKGGWESDFWVAGGMQTSAFGFLSQAGVRYEDPENITFAGGWEDVPKGGYDPHAMIAALEQDGIWGGIVQPTQGLSWYRMDPKESDLLSAICRGWNDHVAEFCTYYPDRLKGIAMLNVDDVVDACNELERCAKMGLTGAFIPEYPLAERPYSDPVYERLWWTAQDLEIPLLLHVFTTRPGIPGCEITADESEMTPAGIITIEHWAQYSFVAIIFAGVFDRYPKLKLGSVEHEAAWVPHLWHRMDFIYGERIEMAGGYRSKRGLLPSEIWRENIFVEFMEDAIGIGMHEIIGADNLQWGNDYPHAESTWPRSMDFLDRAFAGQSEEVRRKITSENAAKMYKFW
jgi:predicted TIM-barrel fold metal-dependent hydrolase